jgi:hypothetical protein
MGNVVALMRRGRIAEALLGTRAAQGGVSKAGGSRMLGQRDRGYQRTREPR